MSSQVSTRRNERSARYGRRRARRIVNVRDHIFLCGRCEHASAVCIEHGQATVCLDGLYRREHDPAAFALGVRGRQDVRREILLRRHFDQHFRVVHRQQNVLRQFQCGVFSPLWVEFDLCCERARLVQQIVVKHADEIEGRVDRLRVQRRRAALLEPTGQEQSQTLQNSDTQTGMVQA